MGTFQTYYTQPLHRAPSDVSWIGSINVFLLFCVGTLTGRLVDAGCRLFPGCFLARYRSAGRGHLCDFRMFRVLALSTGPGPVSGHWPRVSFLSHVGSSVHVPSSSKSIGLGDCCLWQRDGWTRVKSLSICFSSSTVLHQIS